MSSVGQCRKQPSGVAASSRVGKVTRRSVTNVRDYSTSTAAAVVSSTHHTVVCSTLGRLHTTPHCHCTAMADSASESDTDGAGSSSATPMSLSSASNSGKPSVVISQFRLEELTNRLASLQQENKVLKIELETFKLKCKALQEENRDLRKASVTIVSNAS